MSFPRFRSPDHIYELCDKLDDLHCMGVGNRIRAWNYLRQMQRLATHLGSRVQIRGYTWGQVMMTVEDGELLLGGVMMPGTEILKEGVLRTVWPEKLIMIQVDPDHPMPGEHGIPFLGAGAIREIVTDDGDTLYSNIYATPEWSRQENQSYREEIWRKTYGLPGSRQWEPLNASSTDGLKR